jgi:hypothetical protein
VWFRFGFHRYRNVLDFDPDFDPDPDPDFDFDFDFDNFSGGVA